MEIVSRMVVTDLYGEKITSRGLGLHPSTTLTAVGRSVDLYKGLCNSYRLVTKYCWTVSCRMVTSKTGLQNKVKPKGARISSTQDAACFFCRE